MMTRGLAIFQNHMSTIIANKQWWQTRLRHSRQHLKYAFLTGKFLCFWGQTSAHQSLWNQNKRASCAKLCTFWNCSGLLTTQPDSTCCPRARFLFQHVLFSSSANLSAVKEGQPRPKWIGRLWLLVVLVKEKRGKAQAPLKKIHTCPHLMQDTWVASKWTATQVVGSISGRRRHPCFLAKNPTSHA